MGRVQETIIEKKLRSWKLLDDFRSRLAKIRAEMPPPPEKRPGGPERLLLEEDYFSLMLFGMLNPVLDTMRGLCAASHLKAYAGRDLWQEGESRQFFRGTPSTTARGSLREKMEILYRDCQRFTTDEIGKRVAEVNLEFVRSEILKPKDCPSLLLIRVL